MVAARTLQAVAIATSTSRSYPVVVVSVTYAETLSSIYAENSLRDGRPGAVYTGSEDFERRKRHAFDVVIKATMDVNIRLVISFAIPTTFQQAYDNIYQLIPFRISGSGILHLGWVLA